MHYFLRLLHCLACFHNFFFITGPVSEQVMLLENIGTSVLVTKDQVSGWVLLTLHDRFKLTIQ